MKSKESYKKQNLKSDMKRSKKTIKKLIENDEVTQSYMEDGSMPGFAAVYTGGSTHIGTRDYQEDAFFVTEASSTQGNSPIKAFGIVCDGMGGLENGSKASKLATDMMKEVLDNIQTEEGVEAKFLKAIDRIDMRVIEECGFGDGFTTGTTIVAALILGKHLHWVGVGDSRIYVVRGDEIVQVTQDHTFMLKLSKIVDEGLISKEEAETHPQRGALISFIGSGNIQYINTNKAGLDLLHGDIVLLCSDGLTKSLSNDSIAAIIKTWYGDMKETAQQLTLQSFDSSDGAKDNTTVVLMQYFE